MSGVFSGLRALPMKHRYQLSSGEVLALHHYLDRRLDAIGIETQPEVAAKVLELVADPAAQVAGYAQVIRTDAALTGRLLRLANSAYFAQRQAVTSLDRACVLLGVSRLRSFVLGFYLSKAATKDGRESSLSRRVWGESVFRACLGSELAAKVCPEHQTEGFLIGLLLDSGVPLMARLLGEPYEKAVEEHPDPTKLFLHEYTTLSCTHVDIAATLAMRWRLPDVLALPVQWHHVSPEPVAPQGPIDQLHALACYLGALSLDPATDLPTTPSPMHVLAGRTLGLTSKELSDAIARAVAQYHATSQVFSGVAQSIGDLEALRERASVQLIKMIDEGIEKSTAPKPVGSKSFRLGGFCVQIEGLGPGLAAVYLIDADGSRIASHSFTPGEESADSLRQALGLEPDPTDQADPINGYIRALAA